MKELYTASEIAALMKIHKETVYKLGREGKLKRVKVGRSVRFMLPKPEGGK